jgi:hypothetical protein
MGKGGGSDIANKVGEFEANTNLSQSQELYSAQKSLLSQSSSSLQEVGKSLSNGLSNVAK